MKFKINQKIFEEKITTLAKSLPINPALVALNGILFDVKKDLITMMAFDGILSIKEKIKIEETENKVEVIEEGKFLIPGRLLINIIRKQKKNFELTKKNKILHVISGNYNFNLKLLEINDFPNIDFTILGEEFVFNVEKFRKIINDVAFASAENHQRIILNGINIIAKDNYIRVSATDSYRLSTNKLKILSNNNFNITILTKKLKSFIPESLKGEVKVKVDQNKINFEYLSTIIQSKLIDGIYPELSRLIPTEYNHKLEIDSLHLIDLIENATIVSLAENKAIKLEIKEDKLHIFSERDDVGTSHITSTSFKWEGVKNFSIIFESRFLKEALKTFNGKVIIRFINEFKPFVVLSNDKKDLVQLILPQRTY